MASKKIISQDLVYNGHFKVRKYEIENEGGQREVNECFERGESVAAVIYDTDKQKFIFTKQFRIGAKDDLIEIVAGSMDKENEIPIQALVREIKEELGYKADVYSIQHIASVYVSPGGTSEKVHLYFVSVNTKISNGGGLEGEDITLIEKTPLEIVDLNQYDDAKTLIGIQWTLSKMKEGTLQEYILPHNL